MTKQTKRIFSRREMLMGVAASATFLQLNPFEILANALSQGIIDRAHAEATNATQLLNYAYISMAGGPPRWMFDIPLRPNGDDQFFNNPMLITKVDPSNPTGVYASHEISGFHLPYFWAGHIPTSDGNKVPLSALAANLLCMRGLNMQGDGHDLNRHKQITPIPGQPSLTGLAADRHNSFIPAVTLGSSLGYKSKLGSAIIETKDLATLLDPFTFNFTPTVVGRGGSAEEVMDKALLRLREHAEKADPKVRSLFTDHFKARSLFKSNFGNLTQVYANLVAKYESLIKRSFAEHELSGLDKEPIISDGGALFGYDSVDDTFNIKQGTDLRDSFVVDGKSVGQAQNSFAGVGSTIGNLASAMAIIEFVLLNKVSHSVTVNIGGINNLRLPNGSVFTSMGLNNDAHFVGAISTMFYFSKYYKAISACLYELFSQLRVGNMFDKTVVHLSSEFNRSARDDGMGSDHGWQGSSACVFSGMLESLAVVGNIEANHTKDKTHKGSWGVAAPLPDLNGREMIIGNVASTVATMLEMDSPTPNDAGFVKKQGNKVTVHASRPKNIAS
jgi:hypothetical protein